MVSFKNIVIFVFFAMKILLQLFITNLIFMQVRKIVSSCFYFDLLVDGNQTSWETVCSSPCSNQIIWPSYRQRSCLPPLYGGDRACPKDQLENETVHEWFPSCVNCPSEQKFVFFQKRQKYYKIFKLNKVFFTYKTLCFVFVTIP